MSLDLTLLPMRQGLNSKYSHEIIEACRVGEKAIRDIFNLNQLPVGTIACFLATGKDGEKCYGELKEDPYGSPLKYTTAEELLSVAETYFLKSAVGYLKALDPLTPVVLYWH